LQIIICLLPGSPFFTALRGCGGQENEPLYNENGPYKVFNLQKSLRPTALAPKLS